MRPVYTRVRMHVSRVYLRQLTRSRGSGKTHGHVGSHMMMMASSRHIRSVAAVVAVAAAAAAATIFLDSHPARRPGLCQGRFTDHHRGKDEVHKDTTRRKALLREKGSGLRATGSRGAQRTNVSTC